MRSRISVALVALCALACASPALAAPTLENETGQLQVNGDGAGNELSVAWVSSSGGRYSVVSNTAFDTTVTTDEGCDYQPGNTQALCTRAPEVSGTGEQFFEIYVAAGGGNDKVQTGYGTLSNLAGPSDWTSAELGEGNDFFGGSERDDLVRAQGGNDIVDGAEGEDNLLGGDIGPPDPTGTDRLYGGPGSDSLSDNDSTQFGNTVDADHVHGGICPSDVATPDCVADGSWQDAPADDDLVGSYLARTNPVTLNLAQAGGQGEEGENDTISGIESGYTGDGSDTVTGNTAHNDIDTGIGADTVDVAGDPGKQDRVECAGTQPDSVTADPDDTVTPACRPPAGSADGKKQDTGGKLQIFINYSIGGGSSAGSATVGSNAIAILKTPIVCTGAGPDCAVRSGGAATAGSAEVVVQSAAKKKRKKKKVRIALSTYSYTVKAGTTGRLAVKLSKKGIRTLRRVKKAKATISVTVRRGSQASTKTVKATLKAPKAKKKKGKKRR